MASYTFTNDGSTIKIETGGSTYSITKNNLKLKVADNILYITDFSGAQNFRIDVITDTVSPASASAEALRSTLAGYI